MALTRTPAHHSRLRFGRPELLQVSLLHQGGLLRSPRAARPPAGPALLSPPRSRPAGARAAHNDQALAVREGVRRGWGGRLPDFSHLPGPGPASSKTRGPLVHIAVRPKACPSCQPAYGPMIMLVPRPGRPPAKPAPPTW